MVTRGCQKSIESDGEMAIDDGEEIAIEGT
jgi:hypothetical protein